MQSQRQQWILKNGSSSIWEEGQLKSLLGLCSLPEWVMAALLEGAKEEYNILAVKKTDSEFWGLWD